MDIKVGEYVRSKIGSIGKVTKIEDNKFLYEDKILITWVGNVTKHSFNLIDLIEVGDYVNGYKVISVDKNAPENCIECIELDRNNAYEYQFISSKDIQSILTHEQFEANCYKTKGE